MKWFKIIQCKLGKIDVIDNKYLESLRNKPVNAFLVGGHLNRMTFINIVGQCIKVPKMSDNGMVTITYKRTNQKLKNGKTVFRLI